MRDPVNGFHPGTEKAPSVGISACWLIHVSRPNVSNIPKALRNVLWGEECQQCLSVWPTSSPGLSHIRPTLRQQLSTCTPTVTDPTFAWCLVLHLPQFLLDHLDQHSEAMFLLPSKVTWPWTGQTWLVGQSADRPHLNLSSDQTSKIKIRSEQ